MYNTVLSKVKVYGMDTDSAFIRHEDIVKLGDIYGDEFAKFKIKMQHHKAILVAPKCYVFFNGKTIIKRLFKGVNTSGDKLIDREQKMSTKYTTTTSMTTTAIGIDTTESCLARMLTSLIVAE
ncbi:hypothetical protein BGW37DRAFT_463408 [Umbelopsis sp. PMI_123]|nr:hypothetical protein BGW37DRAFT_463408 [Umbelopsis sp. PMI_123]